MGRTQSRKVHIQNILDKLTAHVPSWTVQAMGQKRTQYLVTIEPTVAGQIIERCNLRNRKVRQTKVIEYAGYMTDGLWQLMGMLIFTQSGELIDGQHRILAVAESGVPVSFYLASIGAQEAPKVNRYLDIGPPRTLADYLHFNSVPNSHRVAPVLVYERNDRITGSPLQSSKGEKQDYLKIYQSLTEEPFKRTWELMPRGLHGVLGVNRAFLDWFAMRIVRFDDDSAEVFFGLLADPSELKKTDAPYVLRESLIELHRRSQKISLVQQAHMTAKAWRYYTEGLPTAKSKIKHRANEDWPGILGEPS